MRQDRSLVVVSYIYGDPAGIPSNCIHICGFIVYVLQIYVIYRKYWIRIDTIYNTWIGYIDSININIYVNCPSYHTYLLGTYYTPPLWLLKLFVAIIVTTITQNVAKLIWWQPKLSPWHVLNTCLIYQSLVYSSCCRFSKRDSPVMTATPGLPAMLMLPNLMVMVYSPAATGV